jgi:hypothetical protein
MVMATLPFPQERDVSRTLEPSTTLPNPRTGDGRFAKGNPGGPGRPRGAVREAASTLDQVAVEASAELIKVFLELARAGNLEALKRMMARIWPQRRAIGKGNHERRLRALEEAASERLRPLRSNEEAPLGKFPKNRRKGMPAGIRGPFSRTPRDARELREESRRVQQDRRFR